MEVLILIFIIAILFTLGKLEVFSKAGYKWWLGLIPIYSSWILITKVAKMAPYWFVIDLVVYILITFKPDFISKAQILLNIVDFFVTFCIVFNIAKKFKKNPIVHGLIGGIFTGAWLIWLGLSKSVYNDSIEVSSHGPFNIR